MPFGASAVHLAVGAGIGCELAIMSRFTAVCGVVMRVVLAAHVHCVVRLVLSCCVWSSAVE
jgi:hypothetical protein